MKRRLLLFLIALLLISAAAFFYETERVQQPVLPPPAKLPDPLPPVEKGKPVEPEPSAATASEEEAADEPREETVRVNLKKADLAKEQNQVDGNLSIKKQKPKEIMSGVTVEDRELTIQMEKANESLTIRRAKNSDDGQVQLLWKQKF